MDKESFYFLFLATIWYIMFWGEPDLYDSMLEYYKQNITIEEKVDTIQNDTLEELPFNR